MAKNPCRWIPRMVAAVYFVFAMTWIYLSDWWTASLSDPGTRHLVQSAKGSVFVVLSTGLLYVIARQCTLRQLLARREIQERGAHAQMLIDHMSDLVVEVDSRGGVRYACHRYQELFGRRLQEEPDHRSLVDLVEPEDKDKLLQTISELGPEPESAILEVRMETVEGPRWIGWTFRRAPRSPGRQPSIIGAGRDLTDRIEAMEAMRELDERKNEFIATASHELRTPLTAIIGYLDLLRRADALPVSEADRLEWLDNAGENADVLHARILDLLDLSRIERGYTLNLDRQKCDLALILKRAVQTHGTIQSSHPLVLRPLPEPFEAWADPQRVLQVVDNLLSNAVNYSPIGSEVLLEGRVQNGEAIFSIRDRGRGIDAEATERIFEKFYRTDASNTAVGGLGLGLTITLAIVRAHNGTMHVSPREGGGTTFTVCLPQNPPAEPASLHPNQHA